MKDVPTLAEICHKLEEIIAEHVEFEAPLRHDSPLVKEQGFDSLDLIETSFTIQEYFNFEFSDKNPVEELEKALGDGRIIDAGKLTPLGRKMVLQRMPELSGVDLPDEIGAAELQQYYTLETYGRLILEFYEGTPDTCPETGAEILLDNFKPVNGETGAEVLPPTGDELVERWVKARLTELQAST
jgi:acyl carrier protein